MATKAVATDIIRTVCGVYGRMSTQEPVTDSTRLRSGELDPVEVSAQDTTDD